MSNKGRPREDNVDDTIEEMGDYDGHCTSANKNEWWEEEWAYSSLTSSAHSSLTFSALFLIITQY